MRVSKQKPVSNGELRRLATSLMSFVVTNVVVDRLSKPPSRQIKIGVLELWELSRRKLIRTKTRRMRAYIHVYILKNESHKECISLCENSCVIPFKHHSSARESARAEKIESLCESLELTRECRVGTGRFDRIPNVPRSGN